MRTSDEFIAQGEGYHVSARFRLGRSILIRVLLFLLSWPSIAAVRFWDGSASGYWSNGANWSGNVAPADGDDLIFPASIANMVNTNDIAGLELSSIAFLESSYTLRGNSVRLTTTDGVNGNHASGTCTILFDLTLDAGATFSCANAGATLIVDGDVDLNGHNLTNEVTDATGNINIGGRISGAGDVVKQGPGRLLLDGGVDNLYTGITRILAGTLELKDVSNATRMIPGDAVVGDGAILLLTEGNQIADEAAITVVGTGLWDLNGYNETVAGLSFIDHGDIDTGIGTLTLGHDAIVNLDTSPIPDRSVISGILNVGTGTCTIYGRGALSIPGTIVGAADIVIEYPGPGISPAVHLGASNSFSGTLTADGGNVHIYDDWALGATSGGTVVQRGGRITFEGGVHVVGESLTMDSIVSSYSENVLVRGSNSWSGVVNLLRDAAVGSWSYGDNLLVIDGQVEGVGGFVKRGPGTLRLDGPGSNTYTGDTTVEEGVLELADDNVIRYGRLTIGGNEGGPEEVIVRFLADNPIHSSANIVINSTGLLDFNDHTDYVGDLLFDRGRLTTGTGTLRMGGNLIAIHSYSTNWTAHISGNVELYSTAMRTFDIDESVFFDLSAPTFGGGGIVKTGLGRLRLGWPNTYTNVTEVAEGYLEVWQPGSLGETNAGTVVHDGATLELSFNGTVVGEALQLNGEGMSGYGALDTVKNAGWHGPVTLNADSTMYAGSGDRLEINGPISGPGGLRKIGGGTLVFTGSVANTYAGLTDVSQGTLELGQDFSVVAVPGNLRIEGLVRLSEDLQIATVSDVEVLASGLLHCDGRVARIDELTGSGEVRLAHPGWLEIGKDNGSSTFDGVVTGDGLNGGYALGKFGFGTITLSGSNSYTEGTLVHAGALVVHGYQPSGSWVQVENSATLAGTGTVANVRCYADLEPGASPGILTCSNLTFSSSGDYYVQLNGTTPGTEYDQMNVRGTNELGGAELLVTPSFASPAMVGDQFTIINNDGSDPVSGTFNGLPDDSEFGAGGYRFSIDYDDGNDVTLTLVDVPAAEAGAWVTAGNGNHAIDVDECNHLDLAITNTTATPMTGVSAHLASVTLNVMVTQPDSDYPDLPAAGEALNIIPFQVSTLPGFEAGSDIDLDLVVETSSHGAFIVPVVLASGSPSSTPVRYDNATALAIPHVGIVESTNVVSGFSGPAIEVEVSLWITHTWVSDLTLELIAPDGTTVVLSDQNGGSADDYGTGSDDADRTVFDDDAATAITSGSTPFVGTFRPEEDLANLLGIWANGDWRLRITDNLGGMEGTLQTWSLFLYPVDDAPAGGHCGTCIGEINGQITGSDVVQTGRLWRYRGTPASCSRPLAFQDLNDAFPRYCDVYTFTNDSADAACISVALVDTTIEMMAVSYLDSFDPGNLLSNYAGYARQSTWDGSGAMSPSVSHSFLAPPGAIFVITVNEVSGTLQDGTYTLVVSGQPCPPPDLDIELVSDTAVRVDWPSSAGGYRLQGTPNINVFWYWIPNEPIVEGGRFTVTNTAPPAVEFYRLLKP